jgi:predicted nucleic acid-binding protein
MSAIMNSFVCVDASLIIWSLVPFPLSAAAEAVLTQWQADQTALIAPALFAFEVTASLRRLVYLNEITATEGEVAFARFLRIHVRLSQRQAIFPLAWHLVKQFNRPRAYDTAYLALAQLNNCEFWTADEKLYNAVRHELTWVKWIGHYPSTSNGADPQ